METNGVQFSSTFVRVIIGLKASQRIDLFGPEICFKRMQCNSIGNGFCVQWTPAHK